MKAITLIGLGLLLAFCSCTKNSSKPNPTARDSYFTMFGTAYKATTVTQLFPGGLQAYDSVYPQQNYRGVHVMNWADSLRDGSYLVVDSFPDAHQINVFCEGAEPGPTGTPIYHFATGLDSVYATVSHEAGFTRVVIPPVWLKAEFVGGRVDSFQLSADLTVHF
jgi:hypothetical protein